MTRNQKLNTGFILFAAAIITAMPLAANGVMAAAIFLVVMSAALPVAALFIVLVWAMGTYNRTYDKAKYTYNRDFARYPRPSPEDYQRQRDAEYQAYYNRPRHEQDRLGQ